MGYLLFFFYLAILAWALTKSGLVMKAGLDKRWVIILFVGKVLVGCLHAQLLLRSSSLPDTMVFHQEGLKEYQLLFSHPAEYFRNVYESPYAFGYAGWNGTGNSFWNNLAGNLVSKLLSVFNIFTLGNFYCNLIFYNALVFLGSIGLLRFFLQVYPNNIWTCTIGVMLLPSLLFFTSTIHKDGLVFALLGMLFFQIRQYIVIGKIQAKQVLWVTVSLALLLLIRSYVVLALIPALLSAAIASFCKIRKQIAFPLVYLLAAIVFFGVHSISNQIDPPQMIADKQASFLSLPKSNTLLDVPTINPSPNGILQAIPWALGNGLIRPYPTDLSKAVLLLPIFAEQLFFLGLIGLLVYQRRFRIPQSPWVLAGILFAVAAILFIGLVVPILGAIVRYRSLFHPFLITPVLCALDGSVIHRLKRVKK